ncbi:MAG: nucleotidyltransferase domain-containing protein [Myxococcota bacterium]
MEILTEHAWRVAEQVLTAEQARRSHVVVALSGAHAYGFPSPDSDLDLKAIHVAETAQLLGFGRIAESADRLEVIDGVEIDYTSNELRPVLVGILAGNGNYIERVLGHLSAYTSPTHDELRPLVSAALSQRVYGHYRGFAANQRRAFEQAEQPTAKKLLYVLRTALTGVHLLRAGELRIDLNTTADEYGFAEAAELIAAKSAGERVTLDPRARQRWADKLDQLFELLDRARDRSCLPAEPANAAQLESWLIELRKRGL